MKKLLLIEASNVKSIGMMNQIVCFADILKEYKIDFNIIGNNKLKEFCPSLDLLIFSNLNFINKKKIIQKYVSNNPNVNGIIFFGNYGLNIKGVKKIVNFSNLNLLQVNYFKKSSFFWNLKKKYFNYSIKNIDAIIVPTKEVKNLLQNSTKIAATQIVITPFYEFDKLNYIKTTLKRKMESNTFIYMSSTAPHKNHYNLLEAWELLFHRGYSFKLKLSIKENNTKLTRRIDFLKSMGVQIENVNKSGFLSSKDVYREIYNSEFTIFPSLLETFGYALVEGTILDNYVITSRLPYVEDVLVPSAKFNPDSPKSIADIVEHSVINKSSLKKPELIFNNNNSNLIKILNEIFEFNN